MRFLYEQILEICNLGNLIFFFTKEYLKAVAGLESKLIEFSKNLQF